VECLRLDEISFMVGCGGLNKWLIDPKFRYLSLFKNSQRTLKRTQKSIFAFYRNSFYHKRGLHVLHYRFHKFTVPILY